MALSISSPSFSDGGAIPAKYTCNGEDVSPPLEISGVPQDAGSLVLILDDPDAAREPAGIGRTYDHWIVFNIPPLTTSIPEATVPGGSVLGKNDFGRQKYGGPCPPTFEHTYSFRLYALNCKLRLQKGASKHDVESRMTGHVLESATLTGVYKQPRM